MQVIIKAGTQFQVNSNKRERERADKEIRVTPRAVGEGRGTREQQIE